MQSVNRNIFSRLYHGNIKIKKNKDSIVHDNIHEFKHGTLLGKYEMNKNEKQKKVGTYHSYVLRP